MIKKCSFGSMIVGDRIHRSDLLIFPDGRVEDGWRRASGHRLTTSDIQRLLDAGPDILVVGTGIYGRMRLLADLQTKVQEKGIELEVQRTKPATLEYNRLRQSGKKIAACFHLTC